MNRLRPVSLTLVIAGFLLLGGIRTAPAATIVGFEALMGLPNPNNGVINWDVQKGNDPIFRGSGLLDHSAAYTAADVAEALAGSINLLFGGATANDTFVELDPSITRASIRTGTTPEGLIGLFKEDSVSVSQGAINFGPDPNTNMATLLTAGHFSITGPGMLNASFNAPDGTSAAQLAILLASPLSAAGYSPMISGGMVTFLPPATGRVSFLAQGEGLEYAIETVPEPSAFAIVGFGLMIIILPLSSVTTRKRLQSVWSAADRRT